MLNPFGSSADLNPAGEQVIMDAGGAAAARPLTPRCEKLFNGS